MVYYWLTRSVNADIGEACWRRGAFVDFSVTGWMGRDGMERDGIYVARFAGYTGLEKDGAGGEFWERVHVLNRLVQDTLVERKRE